MSADRYLCVHGHFYQPPRENPWLEDIELQDSAYPYHDWNERVTAECYLPNATSRILDGDGFITKIVNNYAKVSFNFGPTLLRWLEAAAPKVYQAILEADAASRETFGGHGNALAQAFHHTILPLSNRRDKLTQIRWGVADFRRRFGRDPEGMWLPEAAVDVESLELLVDEGIAFTVLAPHQAKRVRRIRGRAWKDVSNGSIDPTMPYLAKLPSGRTLHLFFYDGPVSRAVAFERLLQNGDHFASRLLDTCNSRDEGPLLGHIATDGETYGHHHRHGEMALAYALDSIERRGQATLTNYGWYIDHFSPTHEVEIVEDSSWSCIHGIERWRTDCGCHTGGQSGWTQAWRQPLRDALDWLRDELAPRYEDAARALLKDPWAARDEYVKVVLDRSPENVGAFFEAHASRELNADERVRALKLLELQRHAMLMYTSCGWFFNELSGIETVQVIQYAGRTVQLAQDLFGGDYETPFLERLARARSNLSEQGDGAQIWRRYVKPAMVDLNQVAAHYALTSLFEDYADAGEVHCYRADREEHERFQAGTYKAVVGRVRITSKITGESALHTYCAAHLGGHSLHGGVRPYRDAEAFHKLRKEVGEGLDHADIPHIVRLIDQHFPGATYGFSSLFKDPQRRILNALLEANLQSLESLYVQAYEQNAPLMRFLGDLDAPLPRAFQTTAEFVLHTRLRRALARVPPDPSATSLLAEAQRQGVRIDRPGLAYAVQRSIEQLMDRYEEDPGDPAPYEDLRRALDLAAGLPFEVSLWDVQNRFYRLRETILPKVQEQAETGDEEAGAWARRFAELGAQLRVITA